MLNLFAFVADMNRYIVFTKGEETLAQAEANPPKPDTPEFAKTINVLEVYISGKKDRQDRAIALLCNQPVLATTRVVGKIAEMMEDEKMDRYISPDRLGNLPAMIANQCKVAIYEDMTVETPSPRQIGAMHNLLNLVDILVVGYQKKRGCVREISNMATARFENNLPATFTSRIKWAFEPAHTKTNGHAASVAVPANTMAEKLGAALGITPEAPAIEVPEPVSDQLITPPTLVVEADADPVAIMAAEMSRLAGLSPEALDAAKNGADGGVEVHTAAAAEPLPAEVVLATAEEVAQCAEAETTINNPATPLPAEPEMVSTLVN